MASTVIVGGGIIGIATAYHLSEHQPGSSIHLVDSSATLFASASGYAGGFLARDWFHQDLASLGALSFDEHEKLAKQFNGREKWLYAKSVTVNYELPRRKPRTSTGQDWLHEGGSRADVVEDRGGIEDRNSPPWLRRIKGDALSLVDNGERTAVLDPLKLCQFLLERCRAAGVRIHSPAVVLNVGADCHDELSYVRIGYTDCSSETHIPATRILVCAGAWTPSVLESMFPGSSINIPVVPLAGHSLVVRNPTDIGDTYHSIYTSMDDFSPEIYARPNGHIWLGGVNASLRLPRLATGAKPMDAPLEKLKNLARQIIRVGDDELEVIRTGLCFRPVSERGTPYITRIEDVDLRQGYRTRKGSDGGVYVATGHGPWGISLSLGTAKVMAEMMQGRELSADIRYISKRRMPSPFVGTKSTGTASSQLISNKIWHVLLETKIGGVQLNPSDSFGCQCLVKVSIPRRYVRPLLLVKSNRQLEAGISQRSCRLCKPDEVSPGKMHVYLQLHLIREGNQFLHLEVEMEFRVGGGTVSVVNHLPGVE
ncbi:hypothetical protein FANTH_8723 [Fusarium anthophilum]|uniref:FAD dependent oxidoreductase domain-containing protein n=1 Tax=Fusarium anthophilum TaxID=48485 RepID=A0A8H4ZA42_9HYPO|nr:hypothetical protein FANTH_8723 [Fusarium anthophilum]